MDSATERVVRKDIMEKSVLLLQNDVYNQLSQDFKNRLRVYIVDIFHNLGINNSLVITGYLNENRKSSRLWEILSEYVEYCDSKYVLFIIYTIFKLSM